MYLENSEPWQAVKRKILAKYQHYRKLRARMFNAENQTTSPKGAESVWKNYSPELYKLILDDLIPAIESEDYIVMRDIADRVEVLRLREEYADNG